MKSGYSRGFHFIGFLSSFFFLWDGEDGVACVERCSASDHQHCDGSFCFLFDWVGVGYVVFEMRVCEVPKCSYVSLHLWPAMSMFME